MTQTGLFLKMFKGFSFSVGVDGEYEATRMRLKAFVTKDVTAHERFDGEPSCALPFPPVFLS